MRLLLVEDNADLAEDLREIFEEEGLSVLQASDGKSALKAAEDGFDLAIVDLYLPDTVGTALLPELKKLSSEAEILVLTGNADVATAIEAVQAGAFAYLTKPIAPEDLILTVARAQEQVRLRKLSNELRLSLEISEKRHRSIVETIPAFIVALDRSFKIRFVNPFVEKITGFHRQELLGRDFWETLASGAPAEGDLTRSLPRLDEYETDVPCRDGSVRKVQWQWTQSWLKSDDGSGEILYGIGQDVTRQRALERERQVAEKLAIVGTMTAGLAHEIRNPLNAALLQLSLLDRRIGKCKLENPGALKEPLELVRTELTRLSGLLSDFLSFARPREYHRLPVALDVLLSQVVALQREAGAARDITLESEIESGLTVEGDQDALRQVFLNLLTNALDVARARVKIEALREEGHALITIQDDGPGISEEVAKHLFEPFFTTKAQGTGLGLAIVHSIVLAHGGEVSLADGASGGACATVKLPLQLG